MWLRLFRVLILFLEKLIGENVKNLFINLTHQQTNGFLENAPIGTYLFRLSQSSDTTLDFCFVGITDFKTIECEIVYKENSFFFKWKENESSSLNELVQLMKDHCIAELSKDLEKQMNLIIKELPIKNSQVNNVLISIKTICNSLTNNSVAALETIANIVTIDQQLIPTIKSLETNQIYLQTLQAKITDKTILQSYIEWIKWVFLADDIAPHRITMPLWVYGKILENLYQNHRAEMKNNKIVGIPIDDIPPIIEGARKFEVEIGSEVYAVKPITIIKVLGMGNFEILQRTEISVNDLQLSDFGQEEQSTEATTTSWSNNP